MTHVRPWILASRPKTLVAALSPVLIGTTIALSEGIFHPLAFLFTLLTAMGIQILTNLANDYFDFIKGADTAQRKGPLRVVQAGLVSPQAMKRAMILVCALTFFSGCCLIYQGGIPIACLLISSLILAVLYTAGPYSLAYLGLGDIFVLCFFGPLAVLGTYYLQTHHFSKEAFVLGLSPGCFSTAILIANNVRDIDEDKVVNKKTLPVRFGKTFGKWEYIGILFMGLIPILFCCRHHPFSLLTFLILIPAFPLMRSMIQEKKNDPVILNRIFFNTGKLLWVFTFLFCLGWML
ncbi:MAG TPA: 1,4-dihydroxy-2-naphthoate polyprenyltransferase [Rhabdochlamydiaceae bacterium]|jgi:1,4-dihydroxy-2-naphthoate octaprenyltransferase